MMKITKILMGMMSVVIALGAMADDPAIIDVVARQRWPWSRLVDIDYVLKCDPAQSMDIMVTAYDGPAPLVLPLSSFSGDLHCVQRGARRIVWDPTMTAYTTNGVLPEFSVVLTPTPPALYMIVDLTKDAGTTGQITYVSESDLTNGLWGAWVRNPVTNDGTTVESVVWTGVTTNDIYKTDKLVLRRISKGEFKMGDSVPPTISTTLTQDFYAGVFEVTQHQWQLITEATSSDSTLPMATVPYDDIRGATNSVPAVNWPETGGAVLPSSFLGLLRTKTGLANFDLPTEAQWEYLCRAKTTTYFNDGIAGSTTNQLNELGWYSGNCGEAQPVGLKTANAWGLYDVLGNVREWCVDYAGEPLGGFDPPGSGDPNSRIVRGGGYLNSAPYCRPAYRYDAKVSSFKEPNIGFRIVITLP